MPSTRRDVLGSTALVFAGVVSDEASARSTQPDPSTPSDWPMARYDPAGTGHHPTATGPKDGVEIAWEHDTTDWFLGSAPPIRRGETIYATGNGVLALDSRTGARRFGREGPYQSALARARTSTYTTDTLAVTAPSGVFGLNAAGGITIPLVDRSFETERWAGPQSPRPGLFGPAESVSPVAVDETIYTAVPGTDSVVALDAGSGQVRWRTTHAEDEAVSVEFNRPAVRDGRVFVTNWPYQATAYDTDTGEQHWQRELDEQMVLAPAATSEGLVVPSRNRVWLLDTTDGTTRWTYTTDGNAVESTPAVADGRVFVADEQESLHALDLETGEQLWTTPFDGPTTPVVADGVVYAVRSLYSLVAIDAVTGEIRFEYEPSQVPLSPPIVGDGVLYATNRRRVIALEGTA